MLEGCQHMGYLYASYICMPLHTPCTSLCSPYTICSSYVIGCLVWPLYTPYDLGSFGGHQDFSQAFLCLSVHEFASQFITVIPFAHHHCGLLLYWTVYILMSAMFHAAVSSFVVFHYIISSLNSYHGPLLDGA